MCQFIKMHASVKLHFKKQNLISRNENILFKWRTKLRKIRTVVTARNGHPSGPGNGVPTWQVAAHDRGHPRQVPLYNYVVVVGRCIISNDGRRTASYPFNEKLMPCKRDFKIP